MDGDPQAHANQEANQRDPQIKAFLDDIWQICRKHNLMLDRVSPDEPLLIRELEEDDEEWLRSACDTTSPNFDGV